jgi:hypothetical protein
VDDLEEQALVPLQPFIENPFLFALFHQSLDLQPLVSEANQFLTSGRRRSARGRSFWGVMSRARQTDLGQSDEEIAATAKRRDWCYEEERKPGCP